MPTTTFDHLTAPKRDRITAALLTEFSAHSLATAQVARIVKQADIARGAFYKYFADLTDAYQYLYGLALDQIHQAVPTSVSDLDVTATYAAVRDFVDQATASPYYALIQRHFQTNEGLLPVAPAIPATMTAPVWAAMVLSHATIKEIMLRPDSRTASLVRFQTALRALADEA
ncbi:TetR family transcriptional regulator [Lactobacillus sp. PFC-70]|nr:TetR family transcriptional regulator [Lactobacillus sp. PFC-70]